MQKENVSTIFSATQSLHFKDVLAFQVVDKDPGGGGGGGKDVTQTVRGPFSTYPDQGALSNFLSHLLSPEDVHMARVRPLEVDMEFCGLVGKQESTMEHCP